MTRWDEEIYPREEVAAERWPPLQRLLDFHHSSTRKKFWVEHAIGFSTMAVLFFFFGFVGLLAAAAAFVMREIAMAVLIEGIVAIVLKKVRL